MRSAENPHAGQGRAVAVDVGDGIGALVLEMPAELEGVEIELRPATGGHLTHVAVVARPTPQGRTVYSAVFFDVAEGSYELYQRPDGPVRLRVDVAGGEVAHAAWPG
ncbi:MAG TPA: hypothetical protein VKB55_14165 [Nocardioidaceae bacterium]|nr:hypothetical protein [Nocardioidaceae bacterium]